LERQRVRAVLRDLPARQAQILSLRASGLSYREIAGALDVKISSVGALLARAEATFEKAYLETESTGVRAIEAQGGSHAPE
jgi:DNA-directed RNA polymerase specialized sigma24 family protein